MLDFSWKIILIGGKLRLLIFIAVTVYLILL